MKTPMSRFQIHDDLTAPEGSVPFCVEPATGGQLPNFLGPSPDPPPPCAATRAFAPSCAAARSTSPRSSASRWRSPSTTARGRASRCTTGWPVRPACGSTRSPAARKFHSNDPKQGRAAAATSRPSSTPARSPDHLHVEAPSRLVGEQILEAIAYVALERFTAMVNDAGDVPVDGLGRGHAALPPDSHVEPRRTDGGREQRPAPVAGAAVSCPRPPLATAGRRRAVQAPPCCPLYHEAIELIGRAGPARSSACSSTARLCASGRSRSRSRAVGPPAVRAHEGARGARRRLRTVRPAGRCASSTSSPRWAGPSPRSASSSAGRGAGSRSAERGGGGGEEGREGGRGGEGGERGGERGGGGGEGGGERRGGGGGVFARRPGPAGRRARPRRGGGGGGEGGGGEGGGEGGGAPQRKAAETSRD